VRGGQIYLPAVGALSVDASTSRTSVLRLSPRRLAADREIRGWQTVRHVSVAGLSATVDDVDPFRDCQVLPTAGRLSAGRWKSWRLALAAAARRLANEVPAYASVLGVSLRSVIPLRPDPSGRWQSGTPRQAFGAVSVALPADVAALSVLLVHEVQHVKLAALLDLFDFFDRSDSRKFRVAWRDTPRPIEAILHGTYAHLAIAEVWRSRAVRAPGSKARGLYLMYRSWISDAIEVLAGTGALTPAGERFVAGMGSAVEAWTDAP